MTNRSAIQAGKKFTWVYARAEVLRSLTDITYTVRFLALARLKRQPGTAAKLWVSQILTRKALLEDPKLPAPIILPEALYLELLVGQMSAQETTVFDCPSIGDDLSAKDTRGRYRYTLERIKRSIDDCSNPPHYRGVKTPITELIGTELIGARPVTLATAAAAAIRPRCWAAAARGLSLGKTALHPGWSAVHFSLP